MSMSLHGFVGNHMHMLYGGDEGMGKGGRAVKTGHHCLDKETHSQGPNTVCVRSHPAVSQS